MKNSWIALIVLSSSLVAGCVSRYYKNRLCDDVGYDLYHTMNYCERAWYDYGMSYEGAQVWCRTTQASPLPPLRK